MDKEWSKWSDSEIAKRCAVGNKMVSDLRNSLCFSHSENQTPKEISPLEIKGDNQNQTPTERKKPTTCER